MKMNKFTSLLLAGCMTLGLAACGNTEVQKEQESSETPTPSSTVESSTPEVEVEVEPSFAGTEIEVWGIAKDKYADITKLKHTSVFDLSVVAMMEWCEANDVTLKFAGAWNQNSYMAATTAGQKPDIIFTYGNFPVFANLGITKPITDEGYASITEVVDASYLDVLSYKGDSHGVLLPGNGTYMCYYNKTIFDQYGVKTPKELWLEGNWNWDTFTQTMKDVTKDLDGDGKMDTYGMASSWIFRMINHIEENEDGTITSLIDTDKFRKYADIFYNGLTEGYLVDSTAGVTNTLEYPRPVMQFLDCEIFNLNHFYWELANGDFLEVVPIPKMNEEDDQINERLSYGLFKCASNDNEEATEAMMKYVMECNLKFVSDCSMGAIPCEYAGLQGTCEYSKVFLEKHTERLVTDKAKLDLPHYDAEYHAKINEYNNSFPFVTSRTYSGVLDPRTGTKTAIALKQQPPATSVAELIGLVDATVKTYNNTYVY